MDHAEPPQVDVEQEAEAGLAGSPTGEDVVSEPDGGGAAEELTDEELRTAYRVAVRSRTTEEYFVRLVSRGEVKFSIWGPGEEIHGTAAALALSKVAELDRFGMINHYRSACMVTMWCELHGHDDFSLDLFRQQFSKETDPMTGGRQMVNHYDIGDLGVLPVQSPVGMQLGKAAGYAKGFKVLGIDDSLTVVVAGDGTTGEGDMHDAMNAASVWDLPLLIIITDNNVAISTTPDEGRGIRDFEAYAGAFGMSHFECDGLDFFDCYETTLEAARHVRGAQRGAICHVKDLPRLNAHSSAADPSFDLDQPDPLLDFGRQLVERGLLGEDDIVRRVEGEGRDYFAHHEPGRIMDEEIDRVKSIINQVRQEPDPAEDSIFDHVYPPFPEVQEPPRGGETVISYAGAIRAAIDNIVDRHGGVIWGQDVARLGGVMTATAGLADRHPERIIDSPLNEPLIVGTAVGCGLHDDLVVMPELQFADYSLNAFHWMVYMGNLHWTSNGSIESSVILRMPVDPFGGGAVYHSMSVDGYFTPIPGLVIVMPSTSWDVYGLLLTAAEYGGSVICLEPKFAYRLALGPAFPDEPDDEEGKAALKKSIMRGEIPAIDPDVRVPFGSAATRRQGDDLTVVAWGRAVYTALDAAEELAEEDIEAEVLDLRTLVPPDLESVYASVERTGRLVVAAEDRPFAGFVRSIQGHVVERFQGLPTRAVGQENVPGIAQALVLEEATVLDATDVVAAAHEVLEAAPTTPDEVPAGEGFAWIPSRYYVG